MTEKQLPENHGRPWTEEDEDYLIEHFDKTKDTEEMVEEFYHYFF